MAGPSAADVASRAAEIDARRRAIIENARQKLKAEFRQSQGLPEPAKAEAAPAPAPVPQAPAVPQPVEQTAAARQVAEALTAQLNSQFQAAERMKAEAAQLKAEAERRAAEAEAKLQKFMQNPATYLQESGLNLDQWHARLANGGEPTTEEKLRAEFEAKLAAKTKELESAVNQVKQVTIEERRTKAVAELQSVLPKQYPFVNKMLGAEATLAEIKRRADAAGKAIDAGAVVAELENNFREQFKATLQDSDIATILGLSVQSPPAEVAVQSPRTLSNRVTSTVSAVPTRATSERDRIARGREAIRKLAAAGRI